MRDGRPAASRFSLRVCVPMSAFPKLTDLGWRRRLRSRVLRWYDLNGRKLPWRESADPYRIWISEIMLQQTTVAAVVPYFERFIQRFPTVKALAKAEQSEVLRLWEGLGYYSRARNLHSTAQVIVNELSGEFPRTADELTKLPGIGPYTAGAIASFAFDQPAPIVEANTLRLYSRLIAMEIDPRGAAGQKTLWKFAAWIVSRRRAADFNQAVMDIGSQVCRPRDPECPKCPLMASCKAYEAGLQIQIPLQPTKTVITDVVEVSIAVRRGNQFLLRQCTEKERWAGLWEFVRFELTDAQAAALKIPEKTRAKVAVLPGQQSLFADDSAVATQPLDAVLQAQVQEQTGISVETYRPTMEIRHAVTRYRIRLLCITCEVSGGRLKRGAGFQWYSLTQLTDLPLSRTGRQVADRLE